MPSSTPTLSVKDRICELLGLRSMSTNELAHELKISRRKTYEHCRKLATEGMIAFELTSEKGVFYCLDDECYTAVPFDEMCRKEGHRLRGVPNRQYTWRLVQQ